MTNQYFERIHFRYASIDRATFNFSGTIAVTVKIPIRNVMIKGDGKYLNIAAASICKNYEEREYPMYNWKQNKGYPTKQHREAIKKYGITKYHRKSFRLLPEQLSLQLE